MKEIVFAGFGGQGVLTGGLAMAYIALEKGVNVTWMPSYGPEMRGGKSKCVIKFGETPEEIIPVPMMAHTDILVAMNPLALDYMQACKDGAEILVNADSVPEDHPIPERFHAIRIPCTSLAYEAGNPKGASIAMLGALVSRLDLFSQEFAQKAMCKMFEEKGKQAMNEKNRKAFNAGWDAARKEVAAHG